MRNWSRTFQSFWLHSYCLTLEKQPEKLNFQEYFTSKRLSGGYFQWNACNYFQNICNWARYGNVKLIKKASNFFVTLFRFCFRKTNLKILIFRVFFYLWETLWAATFNETHAPTSEKYVAKQGIVMPNWSKTFQTSWSHSSVFTLEKQPEKLNFQNFFTSKRPWWLFSLKCVHLLLENIKLNKV